MSVLDKMVAAVTPEPSDADRAEVRAKARETVGDDSGWLDDVLDQHEELEHAFEEVRTATSAETQRDAQKRLALMLTSHSIAEEGVLYTAMALEDQKGHATAAYAEQSAAKIQLAALDRLEPLSKDYLDKLEHLRAAVSHHMFEEEKTWFPELANTGDAEFQAELTRRFDEEIGRYDDDVEATGAPMRSTTSSALS